MNLCLGPLFALHLRYEQLKRSRWRYDALDVVGHVYRALCAEAFSGTRVHGVYRDEVQDFTQGELLLDMVLAAGEGIEGYMQWQEDAYIILTLWVMQQLPVMPTETCMPSVERHQQAYVHVCVRKGKQAAA